MEQYKLKGLSCANCAAEMEGKIRKLDHGDTAVLQYNSAKLKVDPQVDLHAVKKILGSDGAAIEEEKHDHSDGHEHDHDHDHSHSGNIKTLLIISTAVFLLGVWLDQQFVVSRMILLPIYLVATAISGYQTFVKGAKNLVKLKFNIDTLMTIALIGAFSIGAWVEGTIVAILFGLNEWLEGMGMEKARRSMEKLLQVAPKQATVIRGGKEVVIAIEDLQVDDLVLVRSGEKIPSDGVVIDGKSSVNEAAITGESMPVEKENGETVFGGSINNEGVLKVKIEKAYEDSSLAKILHLVEEAQETKTPTEQFINRFAKYYTPAIMVISALVITIPPLFFGGDWGTWLYQGLAVLIVGCPCALILSSPIAIVSGITRNARNGILVKGGVFLEQLGKITTIAFDKTGTLTKGEPYVEKTKVYVEDQFFQIAGAIEKSSSHPLAKAIMKKVETATIDFEEPTEIETISGQGIKANIAGKPYWVGNEKSLGNLNIADNVMKDIEQYKEEGLTLVIVADEHQVLGIFGIADEIRSESKDVISQLHQAGITNTVMLTGDHQKTADKVAKRVGVTHYFGNLLPEDKVNKVKELSKTEKVAMIGDGINDAPALATANLGIAMGKGTDSAIETADVVLMQDHLGKLPDAIKIAKKVNKTVKLNITLALGLKVIALLLTIPGWLTLFLAILADMGATVLVTLISLTVLWEGKKQITGVNEL